VYLTLSAEQAGYVLAHSEAVVAFVENAALLERLQSGARRAAIAAAGGGDRRAGDRDG